MRKVATVIFVALCTSACGSAASTTAGTSTPSASIPIGWRTYTYGRAKISVPPDWTVVTPKGCTVRSAGGILALGTPKLLANCPVGVSSIVVASMSAAAAQAVAECPAIKINGLDAHVLPCTSSNARGIVQYVVPALGIEAVGTGTSGENVSGAGTNTVVGRILHTLR